MEWSGIEKKKLTVSLRIFLSSSSSFCVELHHAGWRIDMEDAHLACVDAEVSNLTGIYGVFDGHGGREVAKFCANHMGRFLSLSFLLLLLLLLLLLQLKSQSMTTGFLYYYLGEK